MEIYNIIPKINAIIVFILPLIFRASQFEKSIEPILFIQSILFIVLYYAVRNKYALESRIFKQYYFMHIINFTVPIFIIIFYILNMGNRGSFLD